MLPESEPSVVTADQAEVPPMGLAGTDALALYVATLRGNVATLHEQMAVLHRMLTEYRELFGGGAATP